MSGGWSAKELTERGLKVLVLERGPEIVPERDYTDRVLPWDRPNLDRIPQDEIAEHYPKQYGGVAYAIKETTKHFWVKRFDPAIHNGTTAGYILDCSHFKSCSFQYILGSACG
mgnify:CR=1 FL=1